MSAPRVYVDQPLAEGAVATLVEEAHQHLVVVLRRGPGDRITLFNGLGGEYGAAIETVGKRSLTVRIDERRAVERESPLAVTLGQGISKGDRMEYAIQKAVELGVAAIQPLVTDRVVVRLADERWQRKREHWQGIAVSAAEQSGRTRVPQVGPVVGLRDWIPTLPASALRIALAPGGASAPAPLPFGGQPVALLVGPEGGLSDDERALATRAGFVSLTLGPRTLRTETAAVVALSVMQSSWGDLGSALNQGK